MNDKPRILIDQREQIPLRFSPAVTTESVLLPVGDYSLAGSSERVTVERKRLDELMTCCGKDRPRFIEQIERMRGYEVKHLVIETRFSNIALGITRSQLNPLSAIGTLIKFASDWGLPVWFAEDAAGAALLVERIMLREWKRQQVAAKAAKKESGDGI